jgi:hypothetical protein
MNGFSERDFGVLARVLDSLAATVNLNNHYDVYSAAEHAFRVALEEEAQFAKLIGEEPNSWRAGLRLLHEFTTEYQESLQNRHYEDLDEEDIAMWFSSKRVRAFSLVEGHPEALLIQSGSDFSSYPVKRF